MRRIRKSPTKLPHKVGPKIMIRKRNIKNIHDTELKLQIQFTSTISKFIKLTSVEKQMSPAGCVLEWVQQGLNRDYFNDRL